MNANQALGSQLSSYSATQSNMLLAIRRKAFGCYASSWKSGRSYSEKRLIRSFNWFIKTRKNHPRRSIIFAIRYPNPKEYRKRSCQKRRTRVLSGTSFQATLKSRPLPRLLIATKAVKTVRSLNNTTLLSLGDTKLFVGHVILVKIQCSKCHYGCHQEGS